MFVKNLVEIQALRAFATNWREEMKLGSAVHKRGEGSREGFKRVCTHVRIASILVHISLEDPYDIRISSIVMENVSECSLFSFCCL